MKSLKTLAIRGTLWSIAGYGTSQLLRLGNNLILTRLLVPEFFGLMALITTFITGLNLFSDLGIGQSIIQNQRGDDPEFYNTAWTIQVIRGVGLWLCCLLIASPIANFYQETNLRWLLPTVGLITIFTGFNSTGIFTLRRRMDLGKLILFELTMQLIGLAVMILWAWFNPSLWSLVAGTLVQAFLYMVCSHQLVPQVTNRFLWNQEALNELSSFGRWILIASVTQFLAAQADRLILGKLISLTMLGVYTIAFTFADLPRKIIQIISAQVIFPLVSKQAKLPRASLRAKIIHNRGLILNISAILLAVLVSFGDLVISVLYDQRYTQATWMLPILSLGIWPCLLFNTISPILLSIGKPSYIAGGNLCRFLVLIIGLPLGFSWLGIPGTIIAISLSDIPVYGVILYGCWREQIICLRQEVQSTAIFLGFLILLLISRFSLGWGTPLDILFP